MAGSMQKITIVGCGPGAPDYLSPAGLRAIQAADVLVAAPRLLAVFASEHQEQIVVAADIEAVLDDVAARRQTRKIAVLVTGDPGLASLAQPVLRRFGRRSCEVLPGISSMQAAFARFGLSWLDARILNAHDRLPLTGFPDLAGCKKIAILAGQAEASLWAADLADRLGPDWMLQVCEDLTLAQEKIQRLTPAQLRVYRASSRTIILLIKEECLA